jgi:hypothetical protein
MTIIAGSCRGRTEWYFIFLDDHLKLLSHRNEIRAKAIVLISVVRLVFCVDAVAGITAVGTKLKSSKDNC